MADSAYADSAHALRGACDAASVMAGSSLQFPQTLLLWQADWTGHPVSLSTFLLGTHVLAM